MNNKMTLKEGKEEEGCEKGRKIGEES